MRRGVWANVSGDGRVAGRQPARAQSNQIIRFAERSAHVAQFFLDLRRALRLTLPQAAYYVQTSVEVIEALERGDIEQLPHWQETARVILTYSSMAQVDGRPVLDAVGGLMQEISNSQAQESRREATRRQPRSARQLWQAGSAIATSASRLPLNAISQVRKRPDRVFYALSLPLGALILGLNTSAFSTSVRWVSGVFQEHFGVVRDGMRWIEVDDPRSRRADKLRIGKGS